MEEEKKEDSVKKVGVVGKDDVVEAETSGRYESEGESEDDNFADYMELPKELRGLKDKVFKFEEDLEA